MNKSDLMHDALAQLLVHVPRDWGIHELTADEHKRYSLYKDALASMSPESEADVLHAIQLDPDRVMSQAAIVEYLDREAQRHRTLPDYDDWLARSKESLEGFEFAVRRAQEWRLLKALDAGDRDQVAQLRDASDWLQRKVSEGTQLLEALTALSQDGRTKRIRHMAGQRLNRLNESVE
jgi:hypothetical protein